MALTISQRAPDFELPDVSRHVYRLHDYRGKIVVLLFGAVRWLGAARYIPYMNGFYSAYRSRGVAVFGVDAHAWDTDELIRWVLRDEEPRFPFLDDADGSVADVFGVTFAPTVCVLDRDHLLRYRGPIDDRTRGQPWPEKLHLEEAVDALLLGDDVVPAEPQRRPHAWGRAIERR